MDSTEKKALTWMIEEVLGKLVEGSVFNMIMMDINNLVEKTVKTSASPKEATNNRLNLMFSQQGKSFLIRCVIQHRKEKEYIIDEIIKQYGLKPTKEEYDIYQKEMGDIYIKKLDLAERLIGDGNFKKIHQLSRIK